MTDPDPRVLMARLENVIEAQKALTERLDTLASTLQSSYVPRGEYNEFRNGNTLRFADVSKDIQDLVDTARADAGFRRQTVVSLLIMACGLLVTIAVAVSNMVAR